MKRLPLIFITALFAASCAELQTEKEKTISLLTSAPWKVDSLVNVVKSEAPGLSVVTFDSIYLNYGTWEFQAPGDNGPGFGTGYLLHKYTSKGASHTDSLAWVPYNFLLPASDIDRITIFFPDTTKVTRTMVTDDIQHLFTYLRKDNNIVRIDGGFSSSIGVSTVLSNTKRIHLSR